MMNVIPEYTTAICVCVLMTMLLQPRSLVIDWDKEGFFGATQMDDRQCGGFMKGISGGSKNQLSGER